MRDCNARLKVEAVAFVVRLGHSNDMSYRFLERLCERGLLNQRGEFPDILRELIREQIEYEEDWTQTQRDIEEVDVQRSE